MSALFYTLGERLLKKMTQSISHHGIKFLFNHCRKSFNVLFKDLKLFIGLDSFFVEKFFYYSALFIVFFMYFSCKFKLFVSVHENLSLFFKEFLRSFKSIIFITRIFVIKTCHLIGFDYFDLRTTDLLICLDFQRFIYNFRSNFWYYFYTLNFWSWTLSLTKSFNFIASLNFCKF